MAKKYALQLNTLYKVGVQVFFNNNSVFYPYIYINSGSVDIYGSSGLQVPESISDMVLSSENTNISGHDSFCIVPTYIYITQNTGTTTEIVVDGIEIHETFGELS